MTQGDPVATAARMRALQERRRVNDLAPGTYPEPSEITLREAGESLDDVLGPEAVGRVAAEAANAPGGREGEPRRRVVRAIAGAYLDRSCVREDEDIAARLRSLPWADDGIEASLAFEEDPLERRRRLASWGELVTSVLSVRLARAAARDRAARAAGRASAFDLASCGEPCDPATVCRDVERGAIAPLEEAFGRALRSRTAAAGNDSGDAAAQPRWVRLADFGSRFDRARIAPVLRALGHALGEDPDTQGPVLVRGGGVWDQAFVPPGDRGVVVCGSSGGPGGLRAALRAFGGAARGGAVGRLRGAAAVWGSDPAFDDVAARLFARLILSPPFRAWSGVREDAALLAAVRLAELFALRRAWERSRDRARPAGPSDGDGIVEPARIETGETAELRGAIFVTLLEEDLMTRYGRAWFLAREAGGRLRDMWAVEPDETAESMAQAMSLGRMSADVLVDGFRP